MINKPVERNRVIGRIDKPFLSVYLQVDTTLIVAVGMTNDLRLLSDRSRDRFQQALAFVQQTIGYAQAFVLFEIVVVILVAIPERSRRIEKDACFGNVKHGGAVADAFAAIPTDNDLAAGGCSTGLVKKRKE